MTNISFVNSQASRPVEFKKNITNACPKIFHYIDQVAANLLRLPKPDGKSLRPGISDATP